MMVREALIAIYLFIFQIVFQTFRLFPFKQKTTFIATFGDNILYMIQELEKETDHPFVIIKMPSCSLPFSELTSRTVLRFDSPMQWIQAVYHLATSRILFVDNYLGILAKMKPKREVKCIQLWHAAGAIKRFGLEDPAFQTRSYRARKRIRTVYQRFTHVVVGSDRMVPIFRRGFGNSNMTVLRSGIPRTDFFFRPIEMRSVELVLQRKHPVIGQKKIILYAPTFRDYQASGESIPFDIDAFCAAFCDEYVLFLRLHPSISHHFQNQYPGFVYDVSDIRDVSTLFVVADILITDYSSIPFEFALLERPMIFFAHDLEQYERSRGFWQDYQMLVPGPVVRNSQELIDVMRDGVYDLDRIRAFAAEWNRYSTGRSSKNLIQTIYR